MPKGYPDWAVPINISGQELEQIMTRPKYGACQQVSGAKNCPASTNTELFSIAGTGMIYGGRVHLDASETHKQDLVNAEIDSVSILVDTFQDMNHFAIDKGYSSLFYLNKYDDTAFIYTIMTNFGYTFEVSLKLYYANVTLSAVLVNYQLYYALI